MQANLQAKIKHILHHSNRLAVILEQLLGYVKHTCVSTQLYEWKIFYHLSISFPLKQQLSDQQWEVIHVMHFLPILVSFYL